MQWHQLYLEENPPSFENIRQYINNPLWDELCDFVQEYANKEPKIEYSKCSAQKGWNIKYKKSGKSLCTLYPLLGSFIALVVIGAKEEEEADFILPSCCEYIKELYDKTSFYCGGKWLMIEVRDKEILEDVFKLIRIKGGKTKTISKNKADSFCF